MNQYSERPREFVIATTNPGKIRETTELLSSLRISIRNLNEFETIEVEETGETFRENSDIKASGYAGQITRWTLAEDSGLVVAALGGAPGVRSARFAGPIATDEQNIAKLLAKLRGADNRGAKFVSSFSVSDPMKRIRFRAEGECIGSIGNEARGIAGFGYDPIFIPIGFDRTFAELDSTIKQTLSHRAIAIRKIAPFLRDEFLTDA